MAKRTNRVAWGMAAILAVTVVGGIGVLLGEYNRHVPEPNRWVLLLPKNEWGFGRDNLAAIRSAMAQIAGGVTWPERYRLGLWSIRVDYSTCSRRCASQLNSGWSFSGVPVYLYRVAPQRRARRKPHRPRPRQSTGFETRAARRRT